MLRAPVLLFAFSVGFLLVPAVRAQFADCAVSGESNSTFVIQQATLNGVPLPVGSSVAVYNVEATRCGGVGGWSGSQLAVTVWEADEEGNGGLQVGEVIQFKVWDTSTMHQGAAVQVTYNTSGLQINCDTAPPGTYQRNALCIIASLDVTAALSAPGLIDPSDGSTGVSTSPTLSWEAVDGAASYHVQLATDAGFADRLVDQDGLTATSRGVTGLAQGTAFYWRVRAVGAAGPGPWSAVYDFTTEAAPLNPPSAPGLESPSDGSSGVSTSPTLSWEAVDGAASYHVQLATDADFTDRLVDQDSLTATSRGVTGLAHSMAYYWRVQSRNTEGPGPWSAVFGFTTEAAPLNPPSAPGLESPSDGASGVSTSPTLSWEAVDGAASYHVQLAADADFTDRLADQGGLTASSYAVAGLDYATPYYWRVQSRNTDGPGPWSAVFSFVTKIGPPGSPVPILPLDRTTGLSSAVTFEWQTASGASHYTLQVSKQQDFSILEMEYPNVAATAHPVSSLATPATYYWRVRAANDSGTSAWSRAYTFSTSIPVGLLAPSLVVPLHHANNVGPDVSLIWRIVSFAASYRVQVLRLVPDPDAAPEVVVDSTGVMGTSLALTLTGNTTYLWRVMAQSDASEGTWSVPRQFTTRAMIPTAKESEAALPHRLRLYQNYPNPFNPETTIPFEISEAGPVTLKVFDTLGREVATILSRLLPAGRHEVRWAAPELTSGLYLYQLRAGNGLVSRVFSLVK